MSGETNAIVGAQIRTRRKRANLSAEEVALALGVSVAQQRRYETGETGTDPDVLARLAEVLGCRAADFLKGIEG